MSEQINGNQKDTIFGTFKVLIPYIPTMLFRIPRTLLHIKKMAQRGGNVFQRELIAQGIDQETARKLTESYLETSNLKTYLSFIRRN
ncbi:MAG: hypothetical protein V1769_05580 [Thermoplasmatota archaeon]